MTATLTSPREAPPRHEFPRVAVAATCGWLLMLGAAALIVGGHDLLVAAEISVRLWGTLVFAAGAVLVAGAVGLRHATSRGRALAMVAALVGVALGVMTFLVQVVSDEPDDRLLGWGAIIALSGGAVYVVRAVMPEEERGLGVWKQLPVLKSVVSVGVLISVGQFWYTAIYVPTTAPANLTLEPTLSQQLQGDRQVLRLSVTVRNTSGTRVNVLASYLDLTVWDAGLGRGDDAGYLGQVAESHDASDTPAERYLAVRSGKSVLHASPVPDGTYFEPGETITYDFVTWVPKGLYTLASATIQLTIARGRTLALELAQPKRTASRDGTVEVTPIPALGWLRSLTRGHRYVRVDYDDKHTDDPPLVRITPGPDRAPPDFDRRMWRLYGVSTVSTAVDLPIPPA
jgi:hypothetical protein